VNVWRHLPASVSCSLSIVMIWPSGAAGVAGGVELVVTRVIVARSRRSLTSSVVTVPGNVISSVVDRRPKSQRCSHCSGVPLIRGW
jgi:hypothetical protein